MPVISIELEGVAAELVLGNYMPTDPTIMNNWEEFYHYNDLIHSSQLLSDYISKITIKQDGKVVFSGKIPGKQWVAGKSFMPAMLERAVYLRTECVENAVFTCSLNVYNFDLNKLKFETQDYELLFKTGKSFLTSVLYDQIKIIPEWQSGKPIGNICLLCRYENGFLVPLYDAVKKVSAK